MKNPLLIGVILIAFSSCKKEKFLWNKIKTGETKNLIVTEHDTVIKPIISNGQHGGIYEIDLDEDGINDVKFVTAKYQSNFGGGQVVRMYFETNYNLSAANKVSFSETPQSGVYYFSHNVEYSVADNGTSPIRMDIRKISCDDQFGGEKKEVDFMGFATNCFEPNKKITKISTNTQSKTFDLIRNDETRFFEPTMTPSSGDTLIGSQLFTHGNCEGRAPVNQIFYLTFKIGDQDEERYGWIELFLINEQKLKVLQSAIQSK